MIEGPHKQVDTQLQLFKANYVVTIRKAWDWYQRYFCDTEEQCWQALQTLPFGVNNYTITSPTGKSLAFTVPF